MDERGDAVYFDEIGVFGSEGIPFDDIIGEVIPREGEGSIDGDIPWGEGGDIGEIAFVCFGESA